MCEGVVECTALVLAESCSELEGQLTLFGILDELRPAEGEEFSFMVYAKFEGCEHSGAAGAHLDYQRRGRGPGGVGRVLRLVERRRGPGNYRGGLRLAGRL